MAKLNVLELNMKHQFKLIAGVASATLLLSSCGQSNNGPALGAPNPTIASAPTITLPTGQLITPTAAPNTTYTLLKAGLSDFPNLPAGFAESTALSPDGKTLMVVTSGYNYVTDAKGNYLPNDSTQYLFVFDVSSGTPVQKQIVNIPNTYVGLAFSTDGKTVYVPGGSDDNVHVIQKNAAGLWADNGSPIPLGHNNKGNGNNVAPLASGISVTQDGTRAVVVNAYNDSVSILDLVGNKVQSEQDLRPGKSGGSTGVSGGQYPNSVAIVGNKTAYVSSELDREIDVVDISGSTPSVKARIPVTGNPNKMVLNAAQTTLYVTSDNSDVVSVIDVASNKVTATVSTVAPTNVAVTINPANFPTSNFKGASPNGIAISPDQSTLYVTNRGTNSLAVIALGSAPVVTGLIPTGYYPSDVRVSADNKNLFILNSKTVPGPNTGNCLGYGTVPCPVVANLAKALSFAPNQYILNITGSALQSLPVPSNADLLGLTNRVATNNNFGYTPSANDVSTMTALQSKIQHVIYIVKENRTYDQLLGDLGKGNGNPAYTEFPQKTTPNFHALANNFVNFDNFYSPGDVSGNGWPWSMSAKESDASAKMLAPEYAGTTGSYDWQGLNRNINVGLTGAARVASSYLYTTVAPDVLPTSADRAAPDGPNGEIQQGYIWSAALRAGKTIRNYGFNCDLVLYNSQVLKLGVGLPIDTNPFVNNKVQASPTNPQLVGNTDLYYRAFDDNYPDFYREAEWEREFNGYVANNNLPNLTTITLMNDHTGSFGTAISGVNTPELQMADNDYAVGRLIQAVANSKYASNTLIFIVEDDAQDGSDHVDAHRSPAFVVGPYVKQGATVSTNYTTVNVLRTITDILGLNHLSLNDANAAPMTDAFDLSKTTWSFTATASSLLKGTSLPIPSGTQYAKAAKPTHTAAWWAAKTKGFDFSVPDHLDTNAYNRILWAGLMGDKPYPHREQKSVYDTQDDDHDGDEGDHKAPVKPVRPQEVLPISSNKANKPG